MWVGGVGCGRRGDVGGVSGRHCPVDTLWTRCGGGQARGRQGPGTESFGGRGVDGTCLVVCGV